MRYKINFIPDSGWLDAFNLPTKVLSGLFLASSIILILNSTPLIDVSIFGKFGVTVLTILVVVFGCLLLTSIASFYIEEKKRAHEMNEFMEMCKKIEDDGGELISVEWDRNIRKLTTGKKVKSEDGKSTKGAIEDSTP